MCSTLINHVAVLDGELGSLSCFFWLLMTANVHLDVTVRHIYRVIILLQPLHTPAHEHTHTQHSHSVALYADLSSSFFPPLGSRLGTL
jgi:hypothetical protein